MAGSEFDKISKQVSKRGKMKPFWAAATVFTLAFAVLFTLRTAFFERIFEPVTEISAPGQSALPDRDSWMRIMQDGEKIGYSHTVFKNAEYGYQIENSVLMRLNTMGLVQNIRFFTKAQLHSDLSLLSFTFSITSGRFNFEASGLVKDQWLKIKTESEGEVQRFRIRLKSKPYIAAGMIETVMASGLKKGETQSFYLFDPATMSQQKVRVEMVGKEITKVRKVPREATKIKIDFKGISQTVWIGENGEVLKEEGLLGIVMENTGPIDARSGLGAGSGRDITKLASVPVETPIESAEKLMGLTLKVSGIDPGILQAAQGGRQYLSGDLLTITKEAFPPYPNRQTGAEKLSELKEYLGPAPFIQSDSPMVAAVVEKIISEKDPPVVRVKKIMGWIDKNIRKRPVLSMPDAVATLKNRTGDCNEHSVLMAALCRAASVPCRVEAGLAYLKGRFYYHAWNQVYIIDRWITVDSLFGQFPADVTHVRFTRGTQERQTDILALLGKLKLEVSATAP